MPNYELVEIEISDEEEQAAIGLLESRGYSVEKKLTDSTCVECGAPIIGRSNRMYCGQPCRQRAWRRKR